MDQHGLVSWFIYDLAAKTAERERGGLTRRLVTRRGKNVLEVRREAGPWQLESFQANAAGWVAIT
jgi:ribosomal protein L34